MIFNQKQKQENDVSVKELLDVFESNPEIFDRDNLLLYVTDLVKSEAIKNLRKRGYNV